MMEQEWLNRLGLMATENDVQEITIYGCYGEIWLILMAYEPI